MTWIVEYHRDQAHREPVRDYIDGLRRAGDRSGAAGLERAARLLALHGPALRMPHARIIDRERRIYELRAGDHRAAYVQREGRFVLLHAWRKRTQRLDTREADRARRLAEEV
jgi:phage-related protein